MSFDRDAELIIGLSEELADDLADEVHSQLVAAGARTALLRLPNEPLASLELYLPTAVGVFVMGAFFTGFISRAGEDAYEAVKAGAKALYRRSRKIRVRRIGSSGKVRSHGYSSTFAVGCDLIPTRSRAKLLLQEDLTLEEAEAAIEAFLELMRQLHAGRISDDHLQSLFPGPALGGTYLLRYDPPTRAIVAVDGMTGLSA